MADNISIRLESALRAERDADIVRGATGSGPHRDDVELLLGGEPVRWFGSQGQQRICAIAIRLQILLHCGDSPRVSCDTADVPQVIQVHRASFRVCDGQLI